MRRMRYVGLIAGVMAVSGACTRQDASLPQRTPQPQPAAADWPQNVGAEAAQAPLVMPADSGLAIKRGVITLAADRSTFQACDSPEQLWVMDQTDGVLQQAFGGEANDAPTKIYVEAYGERALGEAPAEASAYAGVFVMEQVLYAGLQEQVRGCATPPAEYVVLARGVEPFWAAEVTENSIVWRQPEAPTELTLAAPQTEFAEGVVRYSANEGAHALEVLIDAQPCQDAMSGEFFAYTARAVLDAKEFNGCARVGK